MTLREFFDPRTRGSTWRVEATAGVTTYIESSAGVAGRGREVHWIVYLLAGIFVAGFALLKLAP